MAIGKSTVATSAFHHGSTKAMTGLKSNIFVNGLIIFGAAGITYLIGVFFYLLISGVIDFLEALVP